MPKKAKRFLPQQRQEILLVPDDKNKGKRLAKLADKFGRTYASVYAVWRSANKVSAKSSQYDNPLVLRIDKSVLYPMRTDMNDVRRVGQALNTVIPSLLPMKGNIPIPNKYAGIARRHLDTNFPQYKFVFSRERAKGKETGITRIFRK